ncbi:MAG: non-ribosomal peptide synthetase, partial [bacterium]|nr:non-ribosomal peptide synthetase [bacterium]
MANEDNSSNTFLYAYFTSTHEAPDLRDYLTQFLPDYMIPTFFLKLEKIPLTHNGKIDRKALAQIQISNLKTQTYTVSLDETEKKLIGIWADVLGIQKDNIGINDDFFQIGGHSLKATILVTRIHKKFNIKLPLTEIFKNPTIRTLTGSIKRKTKEKFTHIKTAEKKDYYTLSSAQKRLYILQEMKPESTAYNMPLTIPLTRLTPVETHLDRLGKIFKQLIRRHDILRTSFHMLEGNPVQVVHDTVEFEIEYCKQEGDNKNSKAGETGRIDEARENFFRHFELSKAPLVRGRVLEITDSAPLPRDNADDTDVDGVAGDGELFLLVDMHHIITDGTSLNILANEFFGLYDGESLPPLKRRYRDYAEWQRSSMTTRFMKQQEEFWIKMYSDEIPILDLPLDYTRPLVRNPKGKKVEFLLNEEETKKLKKIARVDNSTLYMTLLAVFSILLSKLSGQEDIIIGTPTAGRRHVDLENIIG